MARKSLTIFSRLAVKFACRGVRQVHSHSRRGASHLCDVQQRLALLRGDFAPPGRDNKRIEAGDAGLVRCERDIHDADAVSLEQRVFVEVVKPRRISLV